MSLSERKDKSINSENISNIADRVFDFVEANPGIGGQSIVDEVCRTFNVLDNNNNFKEIVFKILDNLVEEHYLFFDFVEDAWYVIEQQNLTVKGVF